MAFSSDVSPLLELAWGKSAEVCRIRDVVLGHHIALRHRNRRGATEPRITEPSILGSWLRRVASGEAGSAAALSG